MQQAMYPRAVAVAVLAGCGGAAAGGATSVPVLEAERSKLTRTGDHAEVIAMCDALAAAHPGRARCDRFGTTPEGRAMVALVASADGTLTPEAARAAARPVIFVEGGIHAGEIEGKDAGFLVLRDALAGSSPALTAATVVFVPVFNVDGAERRGPNNRPNQRGPEEMGFRVTSAGINLNRDFVKADAPEMVALLGLYRRWDPALFVDLHATDGAKFQHDVAVMVAPAAPVGGELHAVAAALSAQLQSGLTARGHLPLAFYPSFVKDDDPSSGFVGGEAPPRFSTGYAAARDRLGVLVETHSWRTYAERVTATVHVLELVLEGAVTDAARWREAGLAAERDDAALAGRDVVLGYTAGPEVTTIDFLGYAYERLPSEVSGGTWTVYDETRPEVWKVPMRAALVPELTVTAPRSGYVVAAGVADAVAARLDAHGVTYQRLAAAVKGADVEAFRAETVAFDPPFEGRTRARLTGGWKRERLDLPVGSLFVPIAQPRARLALHMFEPTAPDSLVGWGFFNVAFERREYMEAYVAEEEARKMLEADPELRRTFEAKVASDAAFAKDPAARLDFFYRRHPAFDARWNLVPVYRVDATPIRGP
jgi:hypothetical protein